MHWKGRVFGLSPVPSREVQVKFIRRCNRLERRLRLRSSFELLKKERLLLSSMLHRTTCQTLTVLQLHCDLLADGEARATLAPLVQRLNLDFREFYEFLSGSKTEAELLRDEFSLYDLGDLPTFCQRALVDYLYVARLCSQNFSLTQDGRLIWLKLGPQASKSRDELTLWEASLRDFGVVIRSDGQRIGLQLPPLIPRGSSSVQA